MPGPVRALLLASALALPFAAHSQTSTPPAPPATTAKEPLPSAIMDTPAQTAAKKLPKDFVNAKPQRFSAEEKRRVEAITRLDEILVEGQIDPEDYIGARKAPMMQFRDRLEKDKPMTPKEKAQLALCFIGLCGIYGPDGAPPEPSRDAKRDARLNQSTTQLNSQFRGTVQ